ncbi:MAG: EAL domain-containing protein [Methylomonas sp.]|nr:EAL domain-containing protein [Methylomonas sp.]
MNSSFSRFSIKSKLFLIALASSFFAMLVAFVILIAANIAEVRSKALDDFSAAAQLIANRSVAAVMFDDNALAQENLNSLASRPDLLNACIYGKHGHLFASLNENDAHCPPFASDQITRMDNLTLHVFQAMTSDQDTVGSVLIISDLSTALLRQFQFVGLVLGVLFVALGTAFFLTAPLLKRVAKPITNLAKTAKKIGENHDYSLRATKYSDDEIGVLVEAFNNMLDTVESKNKTLLDLKNNYQALYDNNPTMVFDLNVRGQIQSVNQFGAKQIGLTVEELQGTSIFIYIHPEDIPGSREFLRLCVDYPHQVHKQEIRLICHNGNIIWLRETARLVCTDYQNKHILLVGEDITETRTLADKIAYQASHDELTGLTNRRQFDIYLQNLVSQAQTDSYSSHIMCYLDLDQFKVVNDTCGHLAGDELLRQLGDLLRQHIRKTDILARLGGDEFGILMAHCTQEQAMIAGDKLRNAIADFQFGWENRSFSVSVSIGIAPITDTSGNAVDVLKEADAACYAAKEKGRNRVHVFSSTDDELAERQGEMQWVEKIRIGIEESRFQLYGQLIVPTGEHPEGLHFETLLRYRDTQGNIIPPGAFLPAAERYNLAPALDRWVISNLFEFLRTTPGFIDRLELCSVNLSGLSLSDETMLNFIAEQFNHWQIPTYKICFEITETAAISNLSYAKHFIDTLHRKGCLFSLDDFGSGLSSFAYLKNLPVDFLKIDGLFVKDILEDKIDWTMVKAINEVGHVMNKKTIAEFVENKNIFDLLKNLGVNYAQGYGIAQPIPLREL